MSSALSANASRRILEVQRDPTRDASFKTQVFRIETLDAI